MNDYLLFVLGVIAAGVGGEFFVRGAVGLAKWARIPAGIIGATIAAFATSSPELAIAINASLDGTPQIALGDALGANIVNISLILGIALLISVIKVPRDIARRDIPVAVAGPLLLAIFVMDGEVSRFEGTLLLLVFLGWIYFVLRHVRKKRSETTVEILGEHRRWLTIVSVVAGLGLLVLAGELVVSGAKGIAATYGMDEFVIGATVVAIGTTMPELATVIISKIKGHDEVGIGTILGSSIFNSYWILSVAALIEPIGPLPLKELAVVLGFAVITAALTVPGRYGKLGRGRGLILVLLYITYLVAVLTS
ncbi:MAG TPA: calcium/sodium antiporter [Pyrinomonadaceae bacterium]|nr:calcium/sodium antiporter [Pyrinomonadaceae bacterium]HMP64386.1 calcium/sodium antiporter [Pyrinomonadaceae bacterium]